MADQNRTFDDELLSGYLDDELAPEERAQVEARLASDSDARKLLDELRVVSDVVKSAPPVTLGDDIHEDVLRRAERAMLVSSAGEPALAGGGAAVQKRAASQLSIGRSTRGWLWAGMAIAAALMLMVFQTEPGQDDELPREVAMQSDEPPAAARPVSDLEFRAVDESPPQPTGGAAEGTAAIRFDADANPGDAIALGETSVDRFSAAPVAAEAPTLGRDGSVAGRVAGAIVESADVETDVLVVNLWLKRDALQKKVFDDVLARNNISVDSSDERAINQSESSSAVSAEEAEEPFFVLVSAEPDQIVACLAEIEADRENYFGIAIDEELVAAKKIAAHAPTSIDWQQYVRGSVPQRLVERRDTPRSAKSSSLELQSVPARRSSTPALKGNSQRLKVLFVLQAGDEPAEGLQEQER
jgi:hypothetical protein